MPSSKFMILLRILDLTNIVALIVVNILAIIRYFNRQEYVVIELYLVE